MRRQRRGNRVDQREAWRRTLASASGRPAARMPGLRSLGNGGLVARDLPDRASLRELVMTGTVLVHYLTRGCMLRHRRGRSGRQEDVAELPQQKRQGRRPQSRTASHATCTLPIES